MCASDTIARLREDRTRALPATPVFFASRLMAEGARTKVVEYCAVDDVGAVKLLVTVTWNAEPARPDLWTPTSSALAAVLLIDQLLEQERVVIGHHMEDEVLQPLRLGMRDLDLIEMHDILDRRDLRQHAPDLDDEVELLRFDPIRPDSTLGDALLLKSCWSLADEHLREGPFGFVTPAQPAPFLQMQPPPRSLWLVEAMFVQILATSALWLLLSL